MEVRETRGGWRAQIVWRAPSGALLVVHTREPGDAATAVWHDADGSARQQETIRPVNTLFDLISQEAQDMIAKIRRADEYARLHGYYGK